MASETQPPGDEVYLLAVLREAQDSVRSFDTKAQIVGIGYIFSLGVIGTIARYFESGERAASVLWLAISLAVLITPIVLYGMVLYPSRRMAPRQGVEAGKRSRVFYLTHDDDRDLASFRGDIEACNWQDELITEIFMVSNLRDIKRRRFLRALYVTAASYALYFAGLLLGAILNG